ncbi:MAG: hypothetical protein ABH864_06350 [archaeon]
MGNYTSWEQVRVGDEVAFRYDLWRWQPSTSGFVDQISGESLRLVSKPSDTSPIRALLNKLPGWRYDRGEVHRIEILGTEESRMHKSQSPA